MRNAKVLDAETLRVLLEALEDQNRNLQDAMAKGQVQEEYLLLCGEYRANLKIIKNIRDWLNVMTTSIEGRTQKKRSETAY